MAAAKYGDLGSSGFAMVYRWLCIPIAADAVPGNTGLTVGEKVPFTAPKNLLKKGDIITKAYVHVKVAEIAAGTKTAVVGLNGTGADSSASGLLTGVPTGVVGMYKGTLGTLLAAGAEHVITTDTAAPSYTLASAHTQLVADVYVLVARVPDDVRPVA